MKHFLFWIKVMFIGVICFSNIQCSKEKNYPNESELVDIEGNKYKTIQIGSQTWMAENLVVRRFKNGDIIDLKIKDVGESNLKSPPYAPRYCNFYDDERLGREYGRLYNYAVVTDERGIAPEGWHIPSIQEWETLIEYLGGDSLSLPKLKETGTNHWTSPNGGTNTSGFTALGSGYRSYYANFNEVYWFLNQETFFWSTTVNLPLVKIVSLAYGRDKVVFTEKSKKDFFSIRCIKDN